MRHARACSKHLQNRFFSKTNVAPNTAAHFRFVFSSTIRNVISAPPERITKGETLYKTSASILWQCWLFGWQFPSPVKIDRTFSRGTFLPRFGPTCDSSRKIVFFLLYSFFPPNFLVNNPACRGHGTRKKSKERIVRSQVLGRPCV